MIFIKNSDKPPHELLSKDVRYVGIGDYAISNNGKIATLALGSCVAIILVDENKNLWGLLHAMLPEPKNSEKAVNEARYVSTGIPKLMKEMLVKGASRYGLKAILVGGANVLGNLSLYNVGARNVAKAKEVLRNERISIIYEDVGGSSSRSVLVDIEGKTVYVWVTRKRTLTLH